MRPWEESENCARRPCVISEIEVVSPRVIEVNRALHKSQAQNVRVEVQVSLRIRSDGSDVVKTNDGAWHMNLILFAEKRFTARAAARMLITWKLTAYGVGATL